MNDTDSKATQSSSTFELRCAVRRTIRATPATVWTLLTDAERFPRWNSTVSKLEGRIALGETLAIQTPAAPGRTFKPKVTKLEPGASMEWSDGFAPMFRGVRTFEVREVEPGVTEFAMEEVFSGVMLPMIRRSLPDFAPIFEAYAADLARAAESAP